MKMAMICNVRLSIYVLRDVVSLLFQLDLMCSVGCSLCSKHVEIM